MRTRRILVLHAICLTSFPTQDLPVGSVAIEFPYGDLNDAVSVAQAIHDNAGMSCTTEQLAAFMNQSVSSGAFRLKVSTARTFGVTDNERGKVSLTELGRRIVNPEYEKRASAAAFLKVPLYKGLYRL